MANSSTHSSRFAFACCIALGMLAVTLTAYVGCYFVMSEFVVFDGSDDGPVKFRTFEGETAYHLFQPLAWLEVRIRGETTYAYVEDTTPQDQL